jgi:DNA-directed RNA polymerase subunit RPC12/RpoP
MDESSRVLRVKCKSCGREFDSGIAMDPGSFAPEANNRIEGMGLTCPHCGQPGSYDKPPDFLWPTD